MYRPNNPQFIVPSSATGRPSAQRPSERAPEGFREGKPNQPQTSKPPPALKKKASGIDRLKSLFIPAGGVNKKRNTTSDDENTQDKITERAELYDSYKALMSDLDKNPSPVQRKDIPNSLNWGRWDIEATTKRPRLSLGASPRPPRDAGSPERAGYSSAFRPLDRRAPKHRPETATTVGLSDPNYKQSSGFTETGRDPMTQSREEAKNPDKSTEITDKSLISCDLCEVELSNGQDLEEHLESKCHWDTLEYIQKHKKYDDMVIAFLQDVMLFKSRQCSRAIEDTALQALQEHDHMTKVEMFHCAACNAFVSTSALSVQIHITTEEHISKTKEFKVRQRRLCLEKAGTMMKELTPQFMCFAKGMSPFE